MSQFLGSTLTEELLKRLSGDDIASQTGKAILVVSVDDHGWAHPAMLSYHEVVAKDRSRIDLTIGKTSTTAKNLKRTGKITLLITDAGLNYYLKGTANELRDALEGIPFMSLFRVEVEQLLEDQEPDALITSGVTFSRPEKQEVGVIVQRIFQSVKKEPL
ncbi:MAG: pyridoxamine 5'-phosphate oxidase family protein [Deltaproteobacteria bacterium]|nr:pyridoxamine 5'-phosphate oxidase family protein [Deltaproteobacteria bacterium]